MVDSEATVERGVGSSGGGGEEGEHVHGEFLVSETASSEWQPRRTGWGWVGFCMGQL